MPSSVARSGSTGIETRKEASQQKIGDIIPFLNEHMLFCSLFLCAHQPFHLEQHIEGSTGKACRPLSRLTRKSFRIARIDPSAGQIVNGMEDDGKDKSSRKAPPQLFQTILTSPVIGEGDLNSPQRPLNRIYDQKVVETICLAISSDRWASGRKRDKISTWKKMHNAIKTPVNNKLNPNPTAVER
jgi:hypothetical protein